MKRRIIAVSAFIDFRRYKNLKQVPARIDTGARTSSLWASDLQVKSDGTIVTFKFFGPGSPFYTGKTVTLPIEGVRTVTSSTGHGQDRYMIKVPILIEGKRISAKFTLSDRSTQVYPVLIGRNTLRGNFLVDSADPGSAAIYKDPSEEVEFSESEGI